MRKHKTFDISGPLLILLLLGHTTKADGTFEDADKSNDYTSGNTNQHYDLRHTIPGEPDVDYPIYDEVPKTSFECTGRHEGYYADVESRCQAFRICAQTAPSVHGFGFLCPNGTLFSQKNFVCDWYRNVNCDESENYFSRNDANRVGSSYDMMEKVRQMMEYPMKTISKALQQTGRGRSSSSSPRQRKYNHQTLKKQLNVVEEAVSSSNNPAGQTATLTSRKKAVTRAQVESVNKSYGNTEEISVAELLPPYQSVEAAGEGPSPSIDIRLDEEGKETPKKTSSDSADDVYVNSLGELSTDPGVKFDRTNAHVIAESPRSYQYGNRMNFAEKVNAGLNDFIESPVAMAARGDEVIAPDYVKTIRKTKDKSTRTELSGQTDSDLASNINGLFDEIASDLDASVSGYQLPSPQKTKHSFKFLSRGFSSQSDRAKQPPYTYGKPKQTESTVRFSPNELPIDDTYKDTFKSQQQQQQQQQENNYENDYEDLQINFMTNTTSSPTTIAGSYLSVPTLLPLDEDSYLSAPIFKEPMEFTHDGFNANGTSELDGLVTATVQPNLEDLDTEPETIGAFIATTNLPPYLEGLSLDAEVVPLLLSPDSATPEVALEVASDIPSENLNGFTKNKQDQASNDQFNIKAEQLDVSEKAANLLLAGVKLTALDADPDEIASDATQTTNFGHSNDGDELLIQTAINSLNAVKATSTEPSTEFAQPSTVTSTPMLTSTETVTEITSTQERIRNYRRFATLQRASAKPLIYSKRASKSPLKTLNKATTAKPAMTTTTRSYLKRVAASRLRLSRLATVRSATATAAASSTTTTAPIADKFQAEASKKSVRHVDKETGSAANDLTDNSNKGKDASGAATNRGAVTWESVRNNLQRYQVNRKRTENNDSSYSKNSTTVPSITKTSVSAVARNSLQRSRNRYSNFKTQQQPAAQRGSGKETATNSTISSPVASSKSPSSSPAQQNSLSAYTTYTSPSSSNKSLQNSPPNSVSTSVSFSSSSSTSHSSSMTPSSKTETPTSTNTNTDSNSFLSFDKLTRSIIDDSILQNFRSSQAAGRSSNSYQAALPAPASVPATTPRNVYGGSYGAAVTTIPALKSAAFGYTKVKPQAPSELIPPPRPHHLPQIQTSFAPAAPTPRIVIARAEGQRIEPNSVSSIISSLVAQQQPRTTSAAPYEALDDFLTKKFGNNVTPSGQKQSYPKITTTAATFYAQQQQPQQQLQQSKQQYKFNTEQYKQQQQSFYLPPTPTQQTPYPQQHRQHQQQQIVSSKYSYQQLQQQQQYQQAFSSSAAPTPMQQISYLTPVLQQQPQQQQKQQQQGIGSRFNYQQQQQPQQAVSMPAPLTNQRPSYLQQAQQQYQQPNIGSRFNYPAPSQRTFYLQQQAQPQAEQQPHQQLSNSAQQPFDSQNIFANFDQHQKQLPAFPPLAPSPTQQSSAPAAASSFQSRDPHLNVALPALANGLIPAPTIQIAQKRVDADAPTEYEQQQLRQLPSTKRPGTIAFTGASSYDVPQSSVGRLPNDITQLLRKFRKF